MLRAAAVVAALALGGVVGVSSAPPLAASTSAQEAPDRCADEPGAQPRPCVGPVTDESGGGGEVWTIVALRRHRHRCRRRRLRARPAPAHGRWPEPNPSPRTARRGVMRIATWNVNSLKARLPRVEEWLEYAAARRAVPPGDEARRRRVPAADVRGARLRLRAPRAGPVERRGDPLAGRARGRDHRLRRRAVDPYEGDARLLAATCGGVRVVSRLRAERPRGRHRVLRAQARVARVPARLARRDRVTRPTPRGARRLQRRARGPRRLVPEGVRGRHARHAARARRRRRAASSGGSSTRSASSTTRTGSSRTGTTAAATSTSTAACASTSCSSPSPSPTRVTWAIVDRNARKGQQPSDHAPVVVDLSD